MTLAAAFAVLGTSVGVDVESALAREAANTGKAREGAARDLMPAPAVQYKPQVPVAVRVEIDPTAAVQGKIEVPSKALPAVQNKSGPLRGSPDDAEPKPERR